MLLGGRAGRHPTLVFRW